MSDKILNSITDSSPCGTDYKYEDVFLEIETEIDKSNSMLEGVSTDWAKVCTASLELLETATKDTKVFCWWVYAMYKTQGSFGLQETLGLFNSLLQTYEDALFPKSKKVKLSALTWLEELLTEELLDERGMLQVSVETETFLTLLQELEVNFSLTVKEDIVVFKKLRSALQRELDAKKVETTSSVTPVKVQNDLSQLSEINSDAEATKVFGALKKNAELLHNYYRMKNSFDIRSIRLVRMLAWMDIDDLPMQTDGKTPLNPPSVLSIDEIETLIAEEEFNEALDKLESLLAVSPFWLEGHLMTYNLLMQQEQIKAAQEVKNSLVKFVSENEGILDLSFKDSIPFASIKLKQWLAENSSQINSESNEVIMVDTKAETIEKAYALVKKKQIKEAMNLLQEQYALAVNQEDKFHWRLAKAELAVECAKKDVAKALLEDLKNEIDRYNLDEWKPKLAAQVFSLYLNTFNRTQVDLEDINTTYARLCKIDIEQALEIKI